MSEETDPDLARLSDGGATATVFDEITAAIARNNAEPQKTITFEISRIPGLEVTYRLPATAQELATIRKATEGEVKKDSAAANRLMLANCCVGLAMAGEQLFEDNGKPMTWASKAVAERFGGTRSTDTLTRAYRGGVDNGDGDGELSLHADELVEAAGFGDKTQVVRVEKDPTEGR